MTAPRWADPKLAKTLLTDGINNTELKKSRNDDDESTDSCSTDDRSPPQAALKASLKKSF